MRPPRLLIVTDATQSVRPLWDVLDAWLHIRTARLAAALLLLLGLAA